MPIRRRATAGVPCRGTSASGGADNLRALYALAPGSRLEWIVASVRATSFAANNYANALARLVAWVRPSSGNEPANVVPSNNLGNITDNALGEGRLIADVDVNVGSNSPPALIPLHGIILGDNEEVVIECSDLTQNDNSANSAHWAVNLLASALIYGKGVR